MKILIPHSWSPSVGDMAVLTATVKMLEEIAPSAEITALVSHPEFTAEKCPHVNARLERWPWPVPGARRSILEVASYPFILMGHFFSAIAYRLFKARIFIFNRRFADPLSAFFDCDVVLSPGGDFINPKYGFVTTFSEFIMAKILGKRLVICAQTIGPFTGFMHGRLAAAVLGLADLIIVRENKTAALLEEIGLRNFHVTADIVFTFPMLPKNARKRILVCAERLDSISKRKAYAEYLRKLSRRIMDEFGCEVVYMPANSADVEFQGEIVSGLDGKIRAIGEVYPPHKVAELASESDFLISSRMHPIILGTLSATPFFAIGDSFKFEEVLGAFCKGCSLKISELDDKSIGIILGKIREREKLGKMIAARLPDARKKAMESGSILKKSFGQWDIS